MEAKSDDFWELIALAKRNYEEFQLLVKRMSRKTLIQFSRNYETAKASFKEEPYIDFVMGNRSEISEDTLDNICQWVVSQGKDYYFRCLNDPTSLPSEEADYEIYLDALGEVYEEYEERYDEPMPYPDELT